MEANRRDSDNVYIEAGEERGTAMLFCVDDLAAAFTIERARVVHAVEGEYGLLDDCKIDSRMAQHLAEVLMTDAPLDQRQAALMTLGAFTPRADAAYGPGSGPPAEESDRQNAIAGVPDDDVASARSSYDPATQHAQDA